MGGEGSGNWYRWDKKSTVEESRVLDINALRKALYPGSSGTVTWGSSGGHQSSVGFKVNWWNGPTVTLQYQFVDGQEFDLPIKLQSTATQFNGRRWWFTCPLARNGRPCDCRAGKLYLPPGGRYFGCRTCYDLTYQSCRESHQVERILGHLGMSTDAELVQMMKERWGSRG